MSDADPTGGSFKKTLRGMVSGPTFFVPRVSGVADGCCGRSIVSTLW